MAKYRLFIGTYSKGPQGGLFFGEFDADSGEISIKGSLDLENPGYLQISPQNGDVLYGVSEISEFKSQKGGALFSADISEPSKIRLLDIQCTHGRLPCHLCAKDNFVFAANYSEGSLSIFETDKTGKIAALGQSIHHFGKGPNPNRQEASHIHFASMDPCGEHLLVCDLGLDKVFLYPYSPKAGLSTKAKTIVCPPGSGPRHLDFSKCGKYLYVLTELKSTVLAYEYSGGETRLLQETSALPEGYAGQSTAAAIHVSPDGTMLGASNRGADCIALFEIADDGRLGSPKYIEGQKEPRDFGFSPDGNWVLSANQNGDCIKIYGNKDGGFGFVGSVAVPSPVCVLFGGQI